MTFEQKLNDILKQYELVAVSVPDTEADEGMIAEVNLRNGWFASVAYLGKDYYTINVLKVEEPAWLLLNDPLDTDDTERKQLVFDNLTTPKQILMHMISLAEV